MDHGEYRIIYRRYASLYFIFGVDDEENELSMLEFIHNLVETMDRHFVNVVCLFSYTNKKIVRARRILKSPNKK